MKFNCAVVQSMGTNKVFPGFTKVTRKSNVWMFSMPIAQSKLQKLPKVLHFLLFTSTLGIQED